MKKPPVAPLALCLLTTLPLFLSFLWIPKILNDSVQERVVNDPALGLSQGLAAVSSEFDRSTKQLILDSLKFSQRDGLKTSFYLAYPNAASAALKPVCEHGLEEKNLDLLAVVGKDGKVLFDNIQIPKPSPVPSPSSKKNPHASMKKNGPTYATAMDWPDLDRALAGERSTGILQVQGQTFQACLFPIENKGKVLGALVCGSRLDKDWVLALQKKTLVTLALRTQQGLLTSLPERSFPKDLGAKGDSPPTASKPQTLTLDQKDFLMGSLPLLDPTGKKTASLTVLQPIQKDRIVAKDPRKRIQGMIIRIGALSLALALAAGLFYHSQYRRLADFVERLSNGSLEDPAPSLALPEWAPLTASLRELREKNLEKDRVSLILGKVMDPLAAKKILSDRDYFSLLGERRDCSLLYADLKGFTTLTENLKPEDLVGSLNRYFTLINEIVFKYEGMLDRFMGGSLLAVWGAPFPHGDKEIRAARCALEIQEALKAFNVERVKKGEPPFTVGIGLHTGPVVAGNLGSNKRFDYSVLGEPLLIAARVCALTAPGQIAISRETFEKLGPGAKGDPMPSLALRDSLESLPIHSLKSLP